MMSYKTLLVHVDHSNAAATRVRYAAQLAKINDAHLIGVAVTGISRYMMQSFGTGFGDVNFAFPLDNLRDTAAKALAVFKSIVEQEGVQSSESVIATDEAASGLALQARYADLVIIGQTDLDQPSPSVMADFPEYLIVNSGRPVLIIPADEAPVTVPLNVVPKTIVIGWDAGREASRAVSDALPLLKLAEVVHVVVFNADSFPYAHGDEPGADIALFLTRHGVKVEVSSLESGGEVSTALLTFAKKANSDLIVLGGYGHSRFRQMIMGGVSKFILEDSTIPLLMSH
jgi:nucleotide-binding universal stress UspA family protein